MAFLSVLLAFSLATSRVQGQSTTTAGAATTKIKNATILYPTDHPTINNIDVLDVTYITNWTSTNLTLWCETNPSTDTWAAYRAPLIDNEGTYILDPVQKKMNIPQFPVSCHIQLDNPDKQNDHILGGGFTMVSTAATTTATFALAGAAATSLGTMITANPQTTASGAGVVTDAAATPTVTGIGIVGGASSSSSGGLSTGAAAGIGVAVGLGVIAICVAAFILWRRRSRKKGYSEQSASTPLNHMPPDSEGYKDKVPAYTATEPVELDNMRHVPVELNSGTVNTRYELQ